MKSYLEKNNLHYFTFSSNSEKPIKAVIQHLPPDMPVEDISNNLEDLGFNTIMRQMMANQRASHGKTYVENLPLLFVTLTKNITSQEIFKLKILNQIIIKVDSCLVRLALHSATTAKTSVMSGSTASNPLDVCRAVVARCIENALKT
jgi:hypothetical protein